MQSGKSFQASHEAHALILKLTGMFSYPMYEKTTLAVVFCLRFFCLQMKGLPIEKTHFDSFFFYFDIFR